MIFRTAILLTIVLHLVSNAPTQAQAYTVGETNTRALRIYYIANGKVNQINVPSNFDGSQTISVNGYVCGIAALGKDPMTVTVDGTPLQRQDECGIDASSAAVFFAVGSIERANFENLYYKEQNQPQKPSLTSTEQVEQRGQKEPKKQGVGYFSSSVIGDAISPKRQFHLDVGIGDSHIYLTIEHQGYQLIPKGYIGRDKIHFWYAGSNLARLRAQTGNFDSRLKAIEDGIDAISLTCNEGLVNNVVLIDLMGVHNAITTDDGDAIWFYVDAFQAEPMEELKVMAQHESLHKFTARAKLSQNTTIRHFYADLLGLGELSMERFRLVTTGTCPSGPITQGANNQTFFDFIDEKNFLKGMKGGHSHTTVDEFCTSFLHSLLFVDRLEQNLDDLRLLSATEKIAVLNNYIYAIETFAASIDRNVQTNTSVPLPLLAKGRAYAKQALTNRNRF